MNFNSALIVSLILGMVSIIYRRTGCVGRKAGMPLVCGEIAPYAYAVLMICLLSVLFLLIRAEIKSYAKIKNLDKSDKDRFFAVRVAGLAGVVALVLLSLW